MIKKLSVIIMSVILFVMCCASLPACSTGDEIVNDENTINVRIYSGGYGTDYIYKLAEKFNTLYQAEGYKVNVLAPQEDLSNTIMLQDIYNKSGVDVYFCACTPRLAVAGPYGKCVVDVTDTIMNKPAISFDGTEESDTVLSKIDGLLYDLSYQDRYYAVPYVLGMRGLAINTVALEKYGLEIPRTSDELFECVSAIMAKAKETSVFPFTYATSGNNYPIMFMNNWLMQSMGAEKYQRFYSMINEDGTDMVDDPYKVFGYEEIEECWREFYKVYDYNIAVAGVSNKEFVDAQADLMFGDAVFYLVGDWMLNEEYNRFKSRLNDVTIVNIPMISSIGEKLFGADSAYGFDEEKSDDILSEICKYADESYDVEDIKPIIDEKFGANIAEADILTVCERRGYVNDTSESYIFISANSAKQDIATLFVRMCASYDGGKLIAQNTRTNNPFALDALHDTGYQWFDSVNKILDNKYMKQIWGNKATGYREKLALSSIFPYTGNYLANYVRDQKITAYDDTTLEYIGADFDAAAKATAEAIYADAKQQFEDGKWKLAATYE